MRSIRPWVCDLISIDQVFECHMMNLDSSKILTITGVSGTCPDVANVAYSVDVLGHRRTAVQIGFDGLVKESDQPG